MDTHVINPKGLIFLLDNVHAESCLQFNRVLLYKYKGCFVTASAYDDPENGTAAYARPTAINIIRGTAWQLKQLSDGDVMLLAVLGEIPAVVTRVVVRILQECEKNIRLVCIATHKETFNGLLQGMKQPAVMLLGDSEIMLPYFDGRPIIPRTLSTEAPHNIICHVNGPEAEKLAQEAVLLPRFEYT